MNSFSEFVMAAKYSVIERVGYIKIDIKYGLLKMKNWASKKERKLISVPYEYHKWKKLRRAKKNGCYEIVKEHFRVEDEIDKKYEALLDSFAETKQTLKECDKRLIGLKIAAKRMHEEESHYNDKFYIDQNGKRRLIAGEIYHYLTYHTYVDGKVVNHREKELTCLKVDNEKYIMERISGEQFWIGYDDLGWTTALYDV